MADAFTYQAELFCRDCGEHLRSVLPVPAGADLADESTWDSGVYPKGPYANGGGEADSPQHCGDCNEFLGNPLTPDGVAYVRRALTIYESTGEGRDIYLRQWADFYQLESHYAEEEEAAEPLTAEEACDYAPQWGSYMTGGDPGAYLYSLDDRGQMPDARHVQMALRYIRGHCYPVADRRAAEGDDDDGDALKLRRLAAYLKGLPNAS